tara:strand:+ start:48 stop:383 length:336 start_codon:yes stop_codon:yes gene_type:complete
MNEQPTLWTIQKPKKSIRERFTTFHNGNPKVYRDLVAACRELRSRYGVKHASIGLLWERLRWLSFIAVHRDKDAEPYKLNDHFRAEYARLIMSREPDLDGFFETRALRRSK